MTIINEDARIIIKQSINLIDNPSIIIYNRPRFIIQATEELIWFCEASCTDDGDILPSVFLQNSCDVIEPPKTPQTIL